jgi:hypothetical protein
MPPGPLLETKGKIMNDETDPYDGQTKCSECCRRFGEMDDEPTQCELCDAWQCQDCGCTCAGDEETGQE